MTWLSPESRSYFGGSQMWYKTANIMNRACILYCFAVPTGSLASLDFSLTSHCFFSSWTSYPFSFPTARMHWVWGCREVCVLDGNSCRASLLLWQSNALPCRWVTCGYSSGRGGSLRGQVWWVMSVIWHTCFLENTLYIHYRLLLRNLKDMWNFQVQNPCEVLYVSNVLQA